MDNLIGKSFGTLKIIRLFGVLEEDNEQYWVCICDCGKYRVSTYKALAKSNTITCGKHSVNTINKSNTKEYRAWRGMKYRCYNKNSDKYKNYGGRGIGVCDRWLNSFPNFFADMGHATTPKHSIDRINVDGNYEPSNCRWATAKEQSNNKTNNIKRRLATSVPDNSCGITSPAN